MVNAMKTFVFCLCGSWEGIVREGVRISLRWNPLLKYTERSLPAATSLPGQLNPSPFVLPSYSILTM
jgi:hypothetical protein